MTTIRNTDQTGIGAAGEFRTDYVSLTRDTVALRYENRINDLRRWAREDEIQPNLDSIQRFRDIIDGTIEFGEASLTMSDAGDIRARWGAAEGPHLSLEFLSDNRVEYALVTHGERDAGLQWDAAICPADSLEAILNLARSAGIKSVWQNSGYPKATPC